MKNRVKKILSSSRLKCLSKKFYDLKAHDTYCLLIKELWNVLFEIRKYFNKYQIQLLVKDSESNAIFSSKNLDFYSSGISRRYYNSFHNYQNGIVNEEHNKKITPNLIILGCGLNLGFSVSESNSNFYKGFYFQTYACYGYNNDLNIQTTNSTNKIYNLYVKPSDISWYPEVKVLNTFSYIPPDTNLTMGFSGYLKAGTSNDTFSDPTCLGQTNGIYDLMIGDKYVTIAGGTVNYTEESIQENIDAINTNQFKNYQGICFDIEAGVAGLADSFELMFKAAKSVGLKVIVSVSHTAPYAFPDRGVLMESFFKSENIDCISTQIYTFDFGTANEYIANDAVSWEQLSEWYKNRKNTNLVVVPSLFSSENSHGRCDLYDTGGTNQGLIPINFVNPKYTVDNGAKEFFEAFGIDTPGYLSWINGELTKK